MAKEIITDISANGLVTQFEIISPTAFNVLRTQDVGGIVDANKRDQNDSSFNNGYTPSRDLKHVARIPLLVLEQWAKEAGIPRRKIYGKEMNEIIRRKLNDPDNKFLRTGLGEI
jgi:hypothetical protein